MRGSARRSAAAERVLSVFGLKLEDFPRICGREFRRAPCTSLPTTFARPPENLSSGANYTRKPPPAHLRFVTIRRYTPPDSHRPRRYKCTRGRRAFSGGV